MIMAGIMTVTYTGLIVTRMSPYMLTVYFVLLLKVLMLINM
jgi:hypothetical protein